MATQKKVAQSRAEKTVQQSSPGKTKVPRLAQGKAPEVPTITQADLEELIYLRRFLDEAHERWVTKRQSIRAALDAGAKTEPGVHYVAFFQLGEFRRLVVR